MDVKVSWQGRMSFLGTGPSGFPVRLGTDPSVGGDNDGPRPMELVAISLAGCTAMDVVSILTKKREQVTDFEVRVHTERSDKHPKVFTSAKIEFLVTGHHINEESVLRAIELSAEVYCSVQAMLKQTMPIEINYSICEDQGEGKRSLVSSGAYQRSEQSLV